MPAWEGAAECSSSLYALPWGATFFLKEPTGESDEMVDMRRKIFDGNFRIGQGDGSSAIMELNVYNEGNHVGTKFQATGTVFEADSSLSATDSLSSTNLVFSGSLTVGGAEEEAERHTFMEFSGDYSRETTSLRADVSIKEEDHDVPGPCSEEPGIGVWGCDEEQCAAMGQTWLYGECAACGSGAV